MDISQLNGFPIETYNQHNLKQDAKRSTCPMCSEDRKPGHKKEKCLKINWDRGFADCFNCDVTLQLHKFKSKDAEYALPKDDQQAILSDKIVGYFNERGISQSTLLKMNIRGDSKIEFPMYDNGVLVNIKYRDAEKNFTYTPGAKLIPFNIDSIRDTDTAYIVEGEVDALSLIEIGIQNVISIPGASTIRVIDDYAELFNTKKEIFLLIDDDKAGIKLRNELIERFQDKVRLVDLQGLNDPNDVLTKMGGDVLLEAISVATQPIKSPDQLLLQDLLSRRITNATQMDPPKVLLNISKTEMFTVGDISCVVGRAGHGKSLLMTLLVSQMISNTETHFNSGLDKKDEILWIDTEQSSWDVLKLVKRINKLSDSTRVNVFNLREFPYANRRKALDLLIEEINPSLVIIDGITDMVSDPNDIKESSETIQRLMEISSQYDCHILGVIHQNEGEGKNANNKARGHIGSEMIRKAEGIIQVEYNKVDTIFNVSCLKGRHGLFNDFVFTRNSEFGTPEFDEQKTSLSSRGQEHVLRDLKKNIDYVDIFLGKVYGAQKIFTSKSELGNKMSDVIRSIETVSITADTFSKALNKGGIIDQMIQDGHLLRQGGTITKSNRAQVKITNLEPDEKVDLPF